MRSRNAKKIHTAGDFKIKGTTLIRYVGKASHVVVPSHVKRLAPRAFYENNSITSVVLPRHIRTIPNECFAWCKNLSSVYIPRGFRDEDILRNQRFEKINVKYGKNRNYQRLRRTLYCDL